MRFIKQICSWILLLCWLYVPAQQQYNISRYTTKDGLKTNRINKTIVLSSGELLIATEAGLSKFDGYRFIESMSAKGNILSMATSGDTIYVFNFNGVLKLPGFFKEKEVLVSPNYTDDDPNNDNFYNLFADNNRNLWMNDLNNIKFYDASEKLVRSFRYNNDNKDAMSGVYFHRIDDNRLWVFTKEGLWEYGNRDKKIHPITIKGIRNPSFSAMAQEKDGRLLVATYDGGFYAVDVNTHSASPVQWWNRQPISQILTIGNKLLIATTNEVFLKSAYDSLQLIFKDHNSSIRNINYDSRTGIIWISTDNGLYKLQSYHPAISFIPTGTVGDKFIAIQKDNVGRLWLLNNRDEVYIKDIGGIRKVHVFNNRRTDHLLMLGNELFAWGAGSIYRWNGQNFDQLNLPNLPRGESPLSIAITMFGEFWVLYKTKILRYTYPALREIKDQFTNPQEFWKDNLWFDLKTDDRGTIWLVGWMPKGFGICTYDQNSKKFEDLSLHKNKDHNLFVADMFTSISHGNNHSLLFSAAGGWNRTDSNGVINQSVWMESYGLSPIVLNGIMENEKHNVFTSSKDGLFVFVQNRDTMVKLSEDDGLYTNDFSNGYYSDGNFIYVGLQDAIMQLDTRQLLQTRMQEKLQITRVIVDGKIRNVQGNYIGLLKGEQNLKLQFSDLSYLNDECVSFRYRFYNEDERWFDLGYSPELILNHISHGKYTIIIEASDKLGNKIEQPLYVQLYVPTPFAKSIWFYGALLLTILIAAYFINRYLWKRKLKDQRYQQDLRDAERKILRSQMNPHFLFNTLNAINSYIIQSKKEEASAYLTSFSKLMRNILKNSKNDIISLAEELETLKLYLNLEQVRLEYSFSYEISVDDSIDDEIVFIPPLILQPFCENAIWHGLVNKNDKGHLIIQIQKKPNDILKVTIQDDGIGRKAHYLLKKYQGRHKSYGIDITRERLETSFQENSVEIIDLYDDNNIAMGTKVIIHIKYKEDD